MTLAPDDPERQRAPTGRTRVCSTLLAVGFAAAMLGLKPPPRGIRRQRAAQHRRTPVALATGVRRSSDAAGASRSPSAGEDAVAREILDAYLGHWDAIRTANPPPNENHPGRKRYATGDAYASVFHAAQTNRLARRALRLPDDSISEHRVEVVSIDGDTATVRDCNVNDGLVVDIDTGEVVNDEGVTRLATGTLRRIDRA